MTIRDLMMTLPLFVMLDFDGLALWEAQMGDTEILVAAMSDGSVQITRQVNGHTPLLVGFSKFDPGVGPLLASWVLVDA